MYELIGFALLLALQMLAIAVWAVGHRREFEMHNDWDRWVRDWTSGDLERFDRALRDRD